MNIKNFGLDAPREEQTMLRILADIEKRFPLPDLGLAYYRTGFSLAAAPGKVKQISALSCFVDDKEGFHAAVVDMTPDADELTMLLTHTKGNAVGFKTTYTFKPQQAVFISFDILKFFFERIPCLAGVDEAGERNVNPYYRKPLEVENILKTAYLDLPETYTQALNIKARDKSTAPIYEFKK